MSHIPNVDCKDAGFKCDYRVDGDAEKCPCERICAKQTYWNERDRFNDWYYDILLSQESCLLRDVLRDCREQLWASWLERNP